MEIYEATLEDAARMEEIVFLAGGNTLHDWSLSDHELGEVRNYDRLVRYPVDEWLILLSAVLRLLHVAIQPADCRPLVHRDRCQSRQLRTR